MTALRTDWSPADLAAEWHAIEQRLAARKVLRGLHRKAGHKGHATRQKRERTAP